MCIERQGLALRLGKEDGVHGRSLEKSAQRVVESPGTRAFVGTMLTDLSCTSVFYETF